MPGFTNTSRVGKRQIRLQQHNADEEFLKLDVPGVANWSTDMDRSKAVKLDGSLMELCANGDEIIGFVESVTAGVWEYDDRQPAAIRIEGYVYALDEAGSLVVGDFVVAGTNIVGGPLIAPSTVGQNPQGRVVVAGAPTKWQVFEVYDAAAADRVVLIRKV